MPQSIVQSLTIEVLALTSFLFMENIHVMFVFLTLHGLASLFLVNALILVLPRRYRKEKVKSMIALYLFCLFFLLPGYIILLITTLYILRRQKHAEPSTFESILLEEVLEDRIFMKNKSFGDALFYLVERQHNIADKQAEIISSIILSMKNSHVFEKAKKFLSSNNDELRLASFFSLYSVEKSLQERIVSIMNTLREPNLSEDERIELLYRLAKTYYEIVDYQLVQKEEERLFLEKARSYLEEIISKYRLSLSGMRSDQEDEKDRSNIRKKAHSSLYLQVYILMAVVNMKLGLYSQALENIEYLMKTNLGSFSNYLIYIMEVLYYTRDYRSLGELIKNYRDFINYSMEPTWGYVADFWDTHG